MKKLAIIGGSILTLLIVSGFLFYYYFISPPEPQNSSPVTFVVPRNESYPDTVVRMQKEGIIRNSTAFHLVALAVSPRLEIPAGGYSLSRDLTAIQVARRLRNPPDMKWVTIPEGWRKEQIGERMAKELNWTSEEVTQWNETYTRMSFDYIEGTYFPDTYLIPIHEKPMETAERLRIRFNEQFAPYMKEFADQDILWTTGLKVASLIQRETNNPEQMPLISGIIWNRLLSGMKLDIDATLQYAKGKTEDSWWGKVVPEDKYIDSPYNTYRTKGLPPTPICNPGIDAIKAAARPVETKCVFYLHDKNGTMYCSETYQEHLENIEKYL